MATAAIRPSVPIIRGLPPPKKPAPAAPVTTLGTAIRGTTVRPTAPPGAGSTGGGGGGGGTGTATGFPAIPSLQQFMGGAGGAAGGAGGTGGAGGAGSPTGTLVNTGASSPALDQSIKEYQARLATLQAREGVTDPNQQFLIDEYKKRLGQDTTQQSIDRAATAIRDQSAGMLEGAGAAGAAMGRGEGFGAGDIAMESGRSLGRAVSGIEAARQAQLDQLVMGGQGIMGAPAATALAREQGISSFMQGAAPYGEQAKFGLASADLGLRQWVAQQEADARARGLQGQALRDYMQMVTSMISASR